MFILDTVTGITVEVEGSGSGVVGSLYTLTCTVTVSDRPASGSSVSIQWQGPAGLSHSDDNDTTDNRVVVSQLALDPLTLAHGGAYTCTAEYTVNGHTTTKSGNRAVSVTSKSNGLLHQCFCDIKLEQVKIGSNVTVNVTWLRGSITLSNSTRVTISAPAGNATSIHSTLTFSPVHLADMATYECHVTVTPLHGLSSCDRYIIIMIPVNIIIAILCSSFVIDIEPVNSVRPEQVVFMTIKVYSVIIQ